MDYLAAALEVKAVQAQQRIISGFAAGIGNTDRVQDVIMPGAFTKTLASKPPGDVAVFIGHKTDSLPVGIPLVIREQAGGLYTETLIKPGPAGDDLLATAEFLQRHGKALGMSIGYRVHPGGAALERGRDGKTLRKLTSVDLLEFSYAAAQSIANPEALVTGVKAMMYRIVPENGEFVLRDQDGEEEGRYPTRAAAEAARRRLMAEGDEPESAGEPKTAPPAEAVKSVWSTSYVNDLPNSSFLFVEPGDDDSEGKRVPRTKRHFPYKDAAGKIDPAHLRNAIARIPQADVPGLDKAALQGRARRMLANLDGSSKTVDVDAPEWQDGIACKIVNVGAEVLAIGDRIAVAQAAMRTLGEDVKQYQRIPAAERQELRELAAQLTEWAAWGDTLDAGREAAAKVARLQRELALLDLAAIA